MGEVNDILASQGGFFSIPIVDAGGNGSKISSVLNYHLRFSPRASRVQENKSQYHHFSAWNPMCRLDFSGGAISS